MAAVTNGAKPAVPENHTLYCSNLPDKIGKEDLKRNLYMLFTSYGPVLDVVALKTAKMRGQAHVLFRDREASASAMRALQGVDFFGKSMVCRVLDIAITFSADTDAEDSIRKDKVGYSCQARWDV